LDDHALTTHTYQSVEAFDPFITTQKDGIHTISRCMDDETKTNKNPKLVFLISHLRVLIWAKDVITGILIEINFRFLTLLFSNTHTMCLILNSAPITAVIEPTKL
jgi:hypothetical protein